MGARKVTSGSAFKTHAVKQSLSLSATDIRVCKNGIEFHAATPVSLWTEMILDLHSPHDSNDIHCNGVVVACAGNVRGGYTVSMLFTHISKHSQEALAALCASRLN